MDNFDYMSLVCNFDEMFYMGVPENRTHNESAVEFLQKVPVQEFKKSVCYSLFILDISFV